MEITAVSRTLRPQARRVSSVNLVRRLTHKIDQRIPPPTCSLTHEIRPFPTDDCEKPNLMLTAPLCPAARELGHHGASAPGQRRRTLTWATRSRGVCHAISGQRLTPLR